MEGWNGVGVVWEDSFYSRCERRAARSLGLRGELPLKLSSTCPVKAQVEEVDEEDERGKDHAKVVHAIDRVVIRR